MTIKNKYIKNSEVKFRKIIKYFSYDFDATQIAKLTNTSRNTITKILFKIRRKIFLVNLNLTNYILELKESEEKEEEE